MTRSASRPILFDVTRLLTRLRFAAPTGIDRVDLAYAARYLSGGAPNGAVSLTPLGPKLLRSETTHTLLGALTSRWIDSAPIYAPAATRLASWLAGPPQVPPPEPAPERRPNRMRGVADLTLRALGAGARQDAARHAPRNAVYLHTSHLRLERTALFDWLTGRPDIRPVFFLHDLIPIEYPEYGVPGEAARHRTRLATMARHAAAIVTNSDAVAESFRAYSKRAGLRAVPTIVTSPLGVEETFGAGPTPMSASRPYFVICSTIEARKNHLLLLQVWRDLARLLPAQAVPALVIVGRRGWESEAAVDLLERCEAIRPHVIEAPNLPTETLASLMAGARAVLMPSFSEGYGIPVAEAVALGTPVIASDLPAHREITRGEALHLDPIDGIGWREAILRATRGEPAHRAGRMHGWPAHFGTVDTLLAHL